MNKKIKMFIIFIVFALISSCKNDVNGKPLKTSEQSLEIPQQIEQEIKKEFNGLLNILETKDLSKLDTSEIEKTIKDVKDKVDKSDAKITSLKTYSEYEKNVKKIREKLKDKLQDKKELEDKLKELEENLKKKKEERKQKLDEAKKEFEGYKNQVNSAGGVTQGQQAGRQGAVGVQAWNKAKEFGLSVSYSNDNSTSDMSKGIIDEAIKKIDEELNNLEDKKEEKKKE